MGLYFKFKELNQDLPLRKWNGFKNYKIITQICMHFKQENPSLHDLLIWIMQNLYSDFIPPVENIEGENIHSENIEWSEGDTLTENIVIIL